MGAIESEHASHDHHKKISGKIKSTYKEGGVIILSDEELKHMWSHYDENHNDLLDLDELEKMVADLLTHTIEDETLRNKVKDDLNKNSKDGDFVKDIFNKMKNKDGVVRYVAKYREQLNEFRNNPDINEAIVVFRRPQVILVVRKVLQTLLRSQKYLQMTGPLDVFFMPSQILSVMRELRELKQCPFIWHAFRVLCFII